MKQAPSTRLPATPAQAAQGRRPPADPTRSSGPRRGEEAGDARPLWRRPIAQGLAVAALAVGLVAAAAIWGYDVGHRDPPRLSTVRGGQLALTYGPEWSRDAGARPIDGLALEAPIALRSRRGILRAGLVRAAGAGLDPAPAALRARWKRPGEPDAVRLGTIPALRYEARLADGGRSLLFMVATRSGYLAVGCEGAARPVRALVAACASVAATIEPLGVTVLPYGPSAQFGRRLSEIMSALAPARAGGFPALASRSLRRRAASAARIAAAHRSAAGQLAAIAVPAQDAQLRNALVLRLDQLAGGFTRLGRAALARDAAAYRRERIGIAVADRRLRQALSALAIAGYELRRGL